MPKTATPTPEEDFTLEGTLSFSYPPTADEISGASNALADVDEFATGPLKGRILGIVHAEGRLELPADFITALLRSTRWMRETAGNIVRDLDVIDRCLDDLLEIQATGELASEPRVDWQGWPVQ